MAGTLAQGTVDTGHEAVQQIIGHEGLDGAGEAAAVDTVGTPACQVSSSLR